MQMYPPNLFWQTSVSLSHESERIWHSLISGNQRIYISWKWGRNSSYLGKPSCRRQVENRRGMSILLTFLSRGIFANNDYCRIFKKDTSINKSFNRQISYLEESAWEGLLPAGRQLLPSAIKTKPLRQKHWCDRSEVETQKWSHSCSPEDWQISSLFCVSVE